MEGCVTSFFPSSSSRGLLLFLLLRVERRDRPSEPVASPPLPPSQRKSLILPLLLPFPSSSFSLHLSLVLPSSHSGTLLLLLLLLLPKTPAK